MQSKLVLLNNIRPKIDSPTIGIIIGQTNLKLNSLLVKYKSYIIKPLSSGSSYGVQIINSIQNQLFELTKKNSSKIIFLFLGAGTVTDWAQNFAKELKKI